MAITGISFAERHWFVSTRDPSKRDTLEESRAEGATIWWWNAIPNIIMTMLGDDQSSSSVEMGATMKQTWNTRTFNRNREAFRHGISKDKGGWENFTDPEGKPIVPEWHNALVMGVSYEVLTDACLNQIPMEIINEIGAHIYNSNSLTEGSKKNLEGLLSPSDGAPDLSALIAGMSSGSKGDAKKKRGSTRKTPKAKKPSSGKTPARTRKKAGAPAD